MDKFITPKQVVLQLQPYINGKHTSDVFEEGVRAIKLDSNESTLSPSPRVLATLTEFIQKSALNWYPDIGSTKLINKLADYTGCPKEYIQTFNGSDNALETICRTFLEPKNEVILCMPTYDHFRVYAQSCDAKLIPVFGSTPFLPKTEKILEAITSQTKIIYIVNPNNPTGILYSQKDITRILSEAPHVLLIVDEAYFEFCQMTMASLVHKHPNLIITRSFSKAFGLAGLRCGYVLTHPKNLGSINKIRIGKNINTLAQIAACAALDDLDYMERYVSEVNAAKKWIVEKLRKEGLKVIVTPANYILIEVSQPQKVLDHLEEQMVFIRDRSFLPQLNGFIRITIGHQLLMERFWKIFKKIPSSYLVSKESKAPFFKHMSA